MSPQWMPQNIQKRLLLYVLQQLSLFLEIDLPNLEEVSLNNITLKDILIDPEKVGKIPGCNLRHGQIKQLELNGGVMGGVVVEIKGLDLVISPALTPHPATDLLFLLAQSTANMANTVVLTDEALSHDVEAQVSGETQDDDTYDSNSRLSSDDSVEKPTSALSGMMARAAEMAVLRLQFNISNLKIKVVSELVDLEIFIDTLTVRSVNGTRKVVVKGVTVTTLKPNVDPGTSDKTGHSKQTDKSASGESSGSNYGTPRDSEDDTDNDDGYGDESLMNSMVFSHEEANSIYMSATAHSLDKLRFTRNVQPPIIFYLDELSMSFEGLTSILELEVHVGVVKVASVPLFPTAIALMTGIARSYKLRGYQKKREAANHTLDNRNTTTRFPQYDTADVSPLDLEEQESAPMFRRFQVREIVVSLTAAIRKNGEFATSSNTYILLSNVNIKNKRKGLIFGGIESIRVVQTKLNSESTILSFGTPNDIPSSNKTSSPSPGPGSLSVSLVAGKADVRFEIYTDDSGNQEVTLLCSKPLEVVLDKNSLPVLVKFNKSLSEFTNQINSLQHTISNYRKISNPIQSTSETPDTSKIDSLVFQTSLITFKLQFIDQSISLVIFPISYKLVEEQVTVQKVILKHDSKDTQESILSTLSNIHLITKSKEFKTHIFDVTGSLPKAISIVSGFNLVIPQIEISIERKRLMKIVEGFKALLQRLNFDNEDKETFGYKSTAALPNTLKSSQRIRRPNVLLSQNFKVHFRLIINQISFKILNASSDFGDLTTVLHKISVSLTLNNDIRGSVEDVSTQRFDNDGNVQDFITEFPKSLRSKIPMILLTIKLNDSKTTLHLHLKNFLLEYYTNWLDIVHAADEVSKPEIVDGPVSHPSTKNKEDASSQLKFEMKITISDFTIGINPGRLPSKLFITTEMITAEVWMAHQFTVKSSCRNICLLLIDDIKNTKEYKSTKSVSSSTLWLLKQGFLQFANINSAHVGVSVDTEQSSRDSINEFNNSKRDIKVHIDEIRSDLCADSTNALVQLINDIRPPIILTDSDKYKVQLPEEINALDGLSDLIDSLISGDSPVFQPQGMEDSVIVDDYYGDETDSELPSSQLKSLTIDDYVLQSIENINEDHFITNKDEHSPNDIAPLLIRLNMAKLFLYIYDGYDWKTTRNEIKEAIHRVEARAMEDRETVESVNNISSSPRVTFQDDLDEDFEIEESDLISETLFESIHVSLPQGEDPMKLTSKVNKNLQNDGSSETENRKGTELEEETLHVKRSKFHKVSAELKGLDIKVNVFSTRDPLLVPATFDHFELLNSISIRLQDLEVLDNVPTSSWHKLLGYMKSAGERELLASFLEIDITNVRPDPDLCANEAIIDFSLAPIRLFVDQDTLEFLIRFGAFKDPRFHLPIDEILYIERFQINSIPIKLDYKPKKVDYGGIRSGHSHELVNFFTVDSADLILKSATVYGKLGLPSLAKQLFEAWGPDIQKTQLGGIVSGIAPLRSFVNIGSGVKNLVAIPMKEYKKDQRLMRSLQKGATVFAKTTGAELLKLGVKLAAGTQGLLEVSEEAFGGEGSNSRLPKSKVSIKKESEDDEFYARDVTGEIPKQEKDIMASSQLMTKSVKFENFERFRNSNRVYAITAIDEDYGDLPEGSIVGGQNFKRNLRGGRNTILEDEEVQMQRIVSMYSNQPKGVQDGLIQAGMSIGRNIESTRKAIIKSRNAVLEAESVPKAAVSLAKTAPVVLIRPMIGATEVVQKTLLGLTNQIDPKQRLESEDKYKPQR